MVERQPAEKSSLRGVRIKLCAKVKHGA
jgi:hypothetical protein